MIPPSDHVVRHCSGGKIHSETVLATAFQLKIYREEKYLSVNWIEYFKKSWNHKNAKRM